MEESKGTSATRAKNKYLAANYDRLYPVIKKGRKAFCEAAARAVGGPEASLNDFIISAVEDRMKREAPEVFADMGRADAARREAESQITSKVFQEVQKIVDKDADYTEWAAIYEEIAQAARAGADFSGVGSLSDIRALISGGGPDGV